MEYHAYIFVRQDLSPEQQLIQFGHVACALGKSLPDHVCPHKLNFVGIGVKNEAHLVKSSLNMDDNGIEYVVFREPDIGDEITAVASLPVTGAQREAFRKYKTLRLMTEL